MNIKGWWDVQAEGMSSATQHSGEKLGMTRHAPNSGMGRGRNGGKEGGRRKRKRGEESSLAVQPA